MCNNFYVTDTIVNTIVVLELPLCGSHLVKRYSWHLSQHMVKVNLAEFWYWLVYIYVCMYVEDSH